MAEGRIDDSDPAPGRERLIEVRHLRKTFKTGLLHRRVVTAVKDVSFQVSRGEIVGFLGPNGSGKTTTIKILLGLIAATGGTARLFGQPVPSLRARERIGFLPENPYVYPYLTPREFVEMCGKLSGMSSGALRARTKQVLNKVGMWHAADRQVRQLSKGMLQRSALAAAMVADPELLILDEPMSGLDPVGRKEVRDLLFEERQGGRTIFFSTHILSDVETMCDHVTILRGGEVVVSGSLHDLVRGDVLRTDIIISSASDELLASLLADGIEIHERPGVSVIEAKGTGEVDELLKRVLGAGARVIEVAPRRETLEDLFMKRAL